MAEKLKVGDIIKSNCRNCLDDVEMEFRYKDDLYAFVCQNCGVYNYLDEDDLSAK